MKRFFFLCCVLGLLTTATVLAYQEIPARPVIRLDADGRVAEEAVFVYCWPVAVGNNRCDFASDERWEDSLTPLEVESGQPITVIIDNSPDDPTSLDASITDLASQMTQSFPLDTAPQSIFDAELAPGDYILGIDASYTDVAGVNAFVSYRFLLTVLPATSAMQPTAEPSAEAPEVAALPTEAATDEAISDMATEAADLTPEAEATQEMQAAATEEASADLATQAADLTPEVSEAELTETAVPEQEETQESAPEIVETAELLPATVEVLPTETAAAVQAQATTEVEAPTTPAETSAPGQFTATPTATSDLQPTTPTFTPTAAPVEATSTASPAPATATTEPETASGVTPIAPSNATQVSATEVSAAAEATALPESTPLSATATPIDVSAGALAPLELVFAGQLYTPVGASICQQDASGAEICEDRPLENQGPLVDVLQGHAAQVRLHGQTRPNSVSLSFLDPNTLQELDRIERRGDFLILFNVSVQPGTYFLRVTAQYDAAVESYFFRVRVG